MLNILYIIPLIMFFLYLLNQGAYMVVKIIIEMVRMKLGGSDEGIGSLIKDLEEPSESVELRINIVSEPRYAKAKGSEAIETFRNYIEVYFVKRTKLQLDLTSVKR
jgi:hypothetical protein